MIVVEPEYVLPSHDWHVFEVEFHAVPALHVIVHGQFLLVQGPLYVAPLGAFSHCEHEEEFLVLYSFVLHFIQLPENS